MTTEQTLMSAEQSRLLLILSKNKKMWGVSLEGLFSISTIRSALRKGWIKHDRSTNSYSLTDDGQKAFANKKVK